MDIDIKEGRIKRNVDNGDGMPPGKQQRVISPLYSSSEHATEYPAPVDKERDVLASALVAGGQAGIASDHRSLRVLFAAVQAADRNHLLGDLQAVNFDQDAG